MKVQKRQGQPGRSVTRRKSGDPAKSFILVTACTCAAVVLAAGGRIGDNSKKQVYAASGNENETFSSQSVESGSDILPTGIAGVMSGVNSTVTRQKSVERIGTSCEQVMVGQRVKKIDDSVAEFDVSASMENKINALDEKYISSAQKSAIMSDEDYDTLLRIVEAEAGTEDIKGRVLVANVIMNRVQNEEFPDNVTEVVWESHLSLMQAGGGKSSANCPLPEGSSSPWGLSSGTLHNSKEPPPSEGFPQTRKPCFV